MLEWKWADWLIKGCNLGIASLPLPCCLGPSVWAHPYGSLSPLPCASSHSPHLSISWGFSQPPCFTITWQWLLCSFLLPSTHIWPQAPANLFPACTCGADMKISPECPKVKGVCQPHSPAQSFAACLAPSFPHSNVMAEKPDEKLWDHLPISCCDCLPTPSCPLLHAGLLPVRTLLVPSLFILQTLSPSSKKDQSGAYTWHWNFQLEWLDWSYIRKQGLLKCQTTWTGNVTGTALGAGWLRSCHIELDRESSQPAEWSSPLAIFNNVFSFREFLMDQFTTVKLTILNAAVKKM